MVFEHLGAVSEVGRVQDVAEKPREDEHDGSRDVIGRQQRHGDDRTLDAERKFVRDFQLKRYLKWTSK